MAMQDSDDVMIECMELPASMRELYTKACEDDLFFATVSTPTDRKCTTSVVQGRGREVISKVEELSLNSPNRLKRNLGQRGLRPAVQVYFQGESMLGDPYMAIIPFYLSGKATIGAQSVKLNHCYHVYGICRLTIANESGKEGRLGAWAYKLGN